MFVSGLFIQIIWLVVAGADVRVTDALGRTVMVTVLLLVKVYVLLLSMRVVVTVSVAV